MGTTRIKVIDLSSGEKEIKTSRKHAEKLTGVAKIKEEKKPKAKVTKGPKTPKKLTSETTIQPSISSESAVIPESTAPLKPSVLSKSSESSVIRRHHLGQKYLHAAQLIEKNKAYPAKEAVDLLYRTSITHFDPTVEIHINVADKNVRGKVNFPHAVGPKKEKRYLLFTDIRPKIESTQTIWGDQKTIEEIEAGKIKPNRDFDQVIAQPKFMPLLAKVAKILGPAGMMPNPKNGTIAENVTSALEDSSSAGFEYKTDPSAPIVHTTLGKLSYQPEKLTENLKALILAIGPSKVKKAVLCTTMSPAIKLDISSIN